MNKSKSINIVGAGLSGPLLAILLAQKGYKVNLYENRPDMRKTELSAGRSINLALSDRGIKALKLAGVDTELMKETVAMKGRMIHPVVGESTFQTYSGRSGEHINSISRGGLNVSLLNLAESAGVNLFFDHRCIDVDLKANKLTFKSRAGEIVEIDSQITIGADGANSAIRSAYAKNNREIRFSFSQSYLEHGYKELHIPPGENGSFIIEKNALHIWPRGKYMIIALPNFDGSFTVTMFHPYEGKNGFDNLNSKEALFSCFEENYPDLIPLLPRLKEDYFENPTGVLSTIKCFPWQYENRFLLIGDAAHAVVPFYGQGMNASFEDCTILMKTIEEFDGDWDQIMSNYEQRRKIDADAIGDLAEENFYEMRDHVADLIFSRKRKLEAGLEQKFPSYYSKYSLVTFKDDLPYSVAKELGNKQDAFLMEYCEKNETFSEEGMAEVYNQLMKLQS